MEFHHIVADQGKHLRSILAAVSTTAIDRYSTCLVQLLGGILPEVSCHYINVDTTRYVTLLELLRCAHVNELYPSLVIESAKTSTDTEETSPLPCTFFSSEHMQETKSNGKNNKYKYLHLTNMFVTIIISLHSTFCLYRRH